MKHFDKFKSILDEMGITDYEVERGDSEFSSIMIKDTAEDKWPVFVFEDGNFSYIDIVNSD